MRGAGFPTIIFACSLVAVAASSCGPSTGVNLRAGDVPKPEHGVVFAGVHLVGAHGASLYLFEQGNVLGSFGEADGTITFGQGKAVRAIALEPGIYQLGGVSIGSFARMLSSEERAEHPSFEIVAGAGNWIGLFEILAEFIERADVLHRDKFGVVIRVLSDEGRYRAAARAYQNTYTDIAMAFPPRDAVVR